MVEGGSNLEFKFKALTDIWTGGVSGKSDKLHLTGIKGSLRWWYEALIRGLKCYACDPNDNNNRCSFELSGEEKKKVKQGEKSVEEYAKEKICPACYLFGCTGWSGKFILRIYNLDDNTNNSELTKVKTDKIIAGNPFLLQLIETKNFENAEKKLILLVFKLIDKYGSIGAKTTLKPSEFQNKNIESYVNPITNAKKHHLDYGIIKFLAQWEDKIYNTNKNEIMNYLSVFNKRKYEDNSDEWPDLKYFWFINNFYLNRIEINEIIKRDPNNPTKYLSDADEYHKWIGGKPAIRNEAGISKKIFSFHGLDSYGKNRVFNSRCFGYAKVGELDNMINLIEGVVPTLKGKLIKGEDILDKL